MSASSFIASHVLPPVSHSLVSHVQDARGIGNQGSMLQNEIVIDRSLIVPKIENVKQEMRGLESKISKLEESIDSLNKLQHR